MANYELLKQGLVAVIKENGNQEITGQLLQQQLLAIINSLGAGYLLIGAATTTTNPGTPDQNVAYLAVGPGTYTNFGGLVVTDPLVLLKWNGEWSQETLSTGIKALFAAVISDIDDINDAIVAINATVLSLQNNKADKNGWYNGLVAGAAENLIGQMPASAFFTYRQTDDGKAGTGAAQIQTIKGRTLVWNQRLQLTSGTETRNGVTVTRNADGSVTFFTEPGGATADSSFILKSMTQADLPSGHKIYLRGCGSGSTAEYFLRDTQAGSFASGGNVIFTAPASYVNFALFIRAGVVRTTPITFTPNFIDLTAMYQAGNEPATVAAFEAMFKDFPYATNLGTILPYKGTGLKTTGVNQWDEQTKPNYWLNATGAEEPKTGYLLARNYFEVLPSTYYYIKAPNACYIYFYDINKQYISKISLNNIQVQTPAGCYYVRFYISNSYGTTYKNDICFNLTNPSINGQYFPYEEYTLSLPVVGKTATDGNGNAIVPFPDGMHGLPTDYDTATKDGGKQLWRIVHLGDCNWYYDSGLATPCFSTSNAAIGAKASTDKVIVPGYTSQSGFWSRSGNDKCVATGSSNLNISNALYTNAADFKEAMQGVYAVVLLATPVPFTWDEPLPMNYPVNRLGTEMLEPTGVDENGVPQTAPLTAEIIYPIDAIGTLLGLPQDYISQGSDINQLEAMKSAGLITAYTRTFNATTGKYEYTFTV